MVKLSPMPALGSECDALRSASARFLPKHTSSKKSARFTSKKYPPLTPARGRKPSSDELAAAVAASSCSGARPLAERATTGRSTGELRSGESNAIAILITIGPMRCAPGHGCSLFTSPVQLSLAHDTFGARLVLDMDVQFQVEVGAAWDAKVARRRTAKFILGRELSKFNISRAFFSHI